MRKEYLTGVLAVCLCLSLLCGCSGSTPPAQDGEEGGAVPAGDFEPIVLKFSHTRPEDSPDHEQAMWFAQQVEERTDGKITVEVYPNNALGDYETVQERVSMGDIDLFLHGPGVTIDKSLQLAVLPYLIDSWDSAKEYLDTEDGLLYSFVRDHFADLDITLLGSNPCYFACYVSAIPIEDYANPDAHSGVKVRVPQNRSFELMAELFGYIPTPIAATEIYSAMQTGIVNGVFGGGVESWWGMIRDQVRYILPIKTHFETHYLGINTGVFQSLPQEYQQLLLELGSQMQDNGFKAAIANEQKYYDLFQEQGAEIYQVTDEQITAFSNKFRTEAWPELQQNFSDDAVEVMNTIRTAYGLPVVN